MQSLENKNHVDDLIMGFLKNELSPVQVEELTRWVIHSKENKLYFDQFREIWLTSHAINENTKYNPAKAFENFLVLIENNTSIIEFWNKRWFKIATMAAIVVLAFSLGGLVFSHLGKVNTPYNQDKYSEIEVPRGAKATFTLLDGTQVTLNAGSKLRYNSNFGIADRVVELSGEGYFKVAKDKSRPFIVTTSHMNIKALGTEFNVKAYPTDKTIETTLVEGSVRIEKLKGAENAEEVILKPNQKLTLFKTEGTEYTNDLSAEKAEDKKVALTQSEKLIPIHKLLLKENVKVEPVISWKENKWIIEKENLSNLATELERKFDIQIRFESQKLKNFRFTGTLLDEPLEQVLKVMSITAPINYEIKGKLVTFKEGENFDNIYRKLYNESDNQP